MDKNIFFFRSFCFNLFRCFCYFCGYFQYLAILTHNLRKSFLTASHTRLGLGQVFIQSCEHRFSTNIQVPMWSNGQDFWLSRPLKTRNCVHYIQKRFSLNPKTVFTETGNGVQKKPEIVFTQKIQIKFPGGPGSIPGIGDLFVLNPI